MSLADKSEAGAPFGAPYVMKEEPSLLYQFVPDLVTWQKKFSASITELFSQAASDPFSHAGLLFIGACFLYGLVHALGPGHGKFILSGMAATNRLATKKVVFLSFVTAFTQAFIAVALSYFFYLFHQASHALGKGFAFAHLIADLSFVFLGLYLLYEGVKFLISKKSRKKTHCCHGHGHGHAHTPADQENLSPTALITAAAVAGLRPCAGSLLVLIFAALKKMFLLGAIGVAFIGLGVFFTTALIASGVNIFVKTASDGISGKYRLFFNGLRILLGAALVAIGCAGLV